MDYSTTANLLINSTNGSVEESTIGNGCSDGEELDSSNLQNRIVAQVITGILMFGLGCSTEVKEMWKYIKQPKQFATALFLQLVVMPFLGLGLSQAFRMPQAEAIGVIIQSICPGGIYSNIVSYYLDGNINLSIVMTTVSTLFSLGTMPLWLYVFPIIIKAENDNCLRVPFDALGYAILVIIVPLGLGFVLKYFVPKRSEIITKVLTAFGSIALLVYAIIVGFTQGNNFLVNGLSWKSLVVAILLLIIAFICGYLATRIPGLSFTVAARRTVAIETAMQNGALASTIVFVSFRSSYSEFGYIILFSLLYSGIQLVGGFLAVITYSFLKWRGCCKSLIPQNTPGETEINEEASVLNGTEQVPVNQNDKKPETNGIAHLNPAYENSLQDCDTKI